jgi:tetratricopeptide (TPR) repeat protein
LLLRGQEVVGFVRPHDRAELPPGEAAIWKDCGEDIDAFAASLGPDYTILEVSSDEHASGMRFAEGGEPADQRRYYLFHNGEVVGAIDAIFRNGEFAFVAEEEETIANLPDGLQELWRAKRGDLGVFLQAMEEEERRYNYLESLPEETHAELIREMEVDRSEISLHWERGLAMRDKYLFLRALRELEIAAALCDKYAMIDFLAELCNEMGNIYIAFEDYDAAVEVLEEGLGYQAYDVVSRVRLLTNLSQAYDLAGKRKRALEKVEEALAIIPPDIYDSLLAGVYSQAASLYNQEGNFERAIQLYKLATYLADNSDTVSDVEKAMFANNLGMAYLEHDEPQLALEQLKKAVSLQPEDTFYQENLARCYERLR